MDHESVSPIASPQRNGSVDLPELPNTFEVTKAPAIGPAPVDEAAQKAVDDVLYSDVRFHLTGSECILTNIDRRQYAPYEAKAKHRIGERMYSV